MHDTREEEIRKEKQGLRKKEHEEENKKRQ